MQLRFKDSGQSLPLSGPASPSKLRGGPCLAEGLVNGREDALLQLWDPKQATLFHITFLTRVRLWKPELGIGLKRRRGRGQLPPELPEEQLGAMDRVLGQGCFTPFYR